MGGAEFPPCWLFALRRSSTGAYRLFGGANVGLMPRSTSQNFCGQCPCPCNEPQPPSASAGDPPTLGDRSGSGGRSGSVSCGGHCSFLLSPDTHTTFCVPSKSGVSVSLSPVEVLQSNPPCLQSLILWEFLLLLPDPQAGKSYVGLRTFTPVGGLLWYKCSPVCESPT